MGYSVIIAEKPKVASSIARIVGSSQFIGKAPNGYLDGNYYKVTWAFGHLVELKSPEECGFTNGELPMFPERWQLKAKQKYDKTNKRYIPDPIVDKQLETIESLFNNAEKIIVATDAGREGELIFRYIYEFLGCTTPFDRLWISSLTDEAIRTGFQDLQDGQRFNRLSDAARARSQADWLVGFNASRAIRILTNSKIKLSLGRVQTPVLGMICQRQVDIQNFKPTPFWQLKVETEKNTVQFTVNSTVKYKTEQEAASDLEKVKAAGQLRVEETEIKTSTSRPPLLYDLTAIQRAANSKYGYTAKETVDTIQELYLNKFVTYPRTGSRYIPEDVYRTLPSLISKTGEYFKFKEASESLAGKKLNRRSVDDSKVTDHHALLPTGVIPGNLTDKQKNIYEMICTRMFESFSENSISEVTNVFLDARGVKFKAHGSVLKYAGWKGIAGNNVPEEHEQKETEDDDTQDQKLPKLLQGDYCPVNSVVNERKTDKPKPIYTENSLLGEMETCGKSIDDDDAREAMKETGIGTPATRSDIIETLVARTYIERKAKKLIPTDLGMKIYGWLHGRKIMNVKTTGEWERDLGMIEKGTIRNSSFMENIKNFTLEVIKDIEDNCTSLKDYSTEPTRTCPICGKKMKNAKFSVMCPSEEGGCGLNIRREIAHKKLSETVISTLAEGKKTQTLKGFKRTDGTEFQASLVIDPDKKEVTFVRNTGTGSKEIQGRKCPRCGNDLTDNKWSLDCSCGMKIRKTANNVTLTPEQIDKLLNGEKTLVTGMTSQAGKKFDAYISLNTQENKFDYEFINRTPKRKKP